MNLVLIGHQFRPHEWKLESFDARDEYWALGRCSAFFGTCRSFWGCYVCVLYVDCPDLQVLMLKSNYDFLALCDFVRRWEVIIELLKLEKVSWEFFSLELNLSL